MTQRYVIYLVYLLSNYNTSVKDSAKTAYASVLSTRFGPFWELVPDDIRNNKNYSITLGFNYSLRFLVGDIGRPEYNTLRQDILGTQTTQFGGWDAFLRLKYQNLNAEMTLSYIDPGHVDIPGFTGWQFLTTIGFTGGFDLALK